ncbi:DUF547 domain-containing protein [Aestuariirhabdus sp. LZHN29]|uniref:DUF547 domain-containing protein n=1 Tax=Aestuariirhabdus sp. LZHN29 TaxID=3417462 RepID=UPI003CE731B2
MLFVLRSVVLCALLSGGLPAFAAPSAEPWPLWEVYDGASTETLDHRPWQALLDHYLSEASTGERLFAYSRVSVSDRELLSRYLASMAQVDPGQLNRAQQFAYWVNLYNALTVDLILKNYPLDSIRSLGEGWFSFGPWDDEVVTVRGQALTLNDIEHRILRPGWGDPRIHYLVNCASRGCPDLPAQALDGSDNEAQLESAARRFINQDKGLQREGRGIRVSSIYDWYAVDFGDRGGLIQHLKRYAGPHRQQWLVAGVEVSFDYDWRLNESP